MAKPIIAITMDGTHKRQPPRYLLWFDYVAAIEKAGGIPWPVPYRMSLDNLREIIARVDGVLMTGGDDLDPAAWGESWHPEVDRIDPPRQRFECELLKEIEQRDLPTLGVCLGIQLLNVYRGGSLHQYLPDIPNLIEHRKDKETGVLPMHDVHIEPESRLASQLGVTTLSVNSSHKQSVNRVGEGLNVAARAPDGVIEAIEDPSRKLMVAVQWHPEGLHQQPEHLKLFEMLVDAC